MSGGNDRENVIINKLISNSSICFYRCFYFALFERLQGIKNNETPYRESLYKKSMEVFKNGMAERVIEKQGG